MVVEDASVVVLSVVLSSTAGVDDVDDLSSVVTLVLSLVSSRETAAAKMRVETAG